MERFWVDANWIHGSIPPEIGERRPRSRRDRAEIPPEIGECLPALYN